MGSGDEEQAPPLPALQGYWGIGSQPLASLCTDKGNFCGIVPMFQGNLFRLHLRFAYQNYLLVIDNLFVSENRLISICLACCHLQSVLIPEHPWLPMLPPPSLFQQCPQVAGILTAVTSSGFSQKPIFPRLPHHQNQALGIIMVSAAIKTLSQPPRHQPLLLQMQLYQEILSSPFGERKGKSLVHLSVCAREESSVTAMCYSKFVWTS